MTILRSKARCSRPKRPMIYFADDSSLENKCWDTATGLRGEDLPVSVPKICEEVLHRPSARPDIAFWLDYFLGDQGTALNLAVEATMLRERDGDLLEHDGSPDHIDCSLAKGNAWCLGHFNRMFKDETKHYLDAIREQQKPRAVIAGMIYYPLGATSISTRSSWTVLPLRLLGYNRDPARLQAAIKAMYEKATCNLHTSKASRFFHVCCSRYWMERMFKITLLGWNRVRTVAR
ncbi:hypothetical protein FKW77_003528 [Venturia effusa]|uniref:Uncharacterized protein n=1 Tax=Venturia effusa TaxID=50376 RepID=A0A517KZA0_9PEZI|nr:hypothetical protein FKW77_003528 [Venturia effusa]